MRTTIVYHKDGGKSVIRGSRAYRPSYDSIIDKPQHETILNAYKMLESEGKLKGHDNTRKYANFVKQVWAS